MSYEIKKDWYVAHLKPNGFSKAQMNLSRQGFETFMPLRNVTVRHSRKLMSTLRPVFPGYIFIRFSLDNENWRKINSTLGISRLISFNEGRPSKIPEGLIEGFKTRCDAKNILEPISNWREGDKARLVAGPFSDFIGQVEGIVSSDRIRLLFKFMETYKSVEVSKCHLERLI